MTDNVQTITDTWLAASAKLNQKYASDLTLAIATKLTTTPLVPAPLPATTAGTTAALDFSQWNITGDIDENGGFTGNAKMYYPVKEILPFCKFNADGSYTLTARVEGARTSSNTHYARAELRELNGTEKAAWKPSVGGTLTATLSVEEVPVKKDGKPGRIVIGQIHGPSDELCRLYYDNGKTYFINDKAGDAAQETTFALKEDMNGKETTIPLHDKFRYSIDVINGYLTVMVLHGSGVYQTRQPIGKFWTDSQLCYFKAGVYLQVGKEGSGAGTVGTGRGRVTFYGVPKISH